jgi:predicted aminopeptidase
VAVGAYHEYVPGFERLLAECGNDLECFYAAVRELAAAEPEARERRLSATAITGPTSR